MSLSKDEKHVTYFLHSAMYFLYISTMIQHKNLGQYIPHIMQHQIITQLTSNIHFKSVNLSINLVKYEKQYSPSLEAMISVTSRLQCQKISP